MRILVSGGAGFIASHIADKYIEKGHEVHILDNLSSGRMANINKNAVFHEIDLREANKVNALMNDIKPDIVNHHAAQISVVYSAKKPGEDAAINIIGSVNLIFASLKANVKKIIYASSGGAVYGEPVYLPVDELHPVNPISPYGISKHTVEHYLEMAYRVYGLNYVVLRYGNVFGERQDPFGEAGVITIFAQNMLKGDKCYIFGDGEQQRDFVYVRDVVNANVIALNSNIQGIFNIGTGYGTSVNKVFNTLKKYTGYGGEPVYKDKRPGEVYRIFLGIEKAKKYMEWESIYSFEQGIKNTVEWIKGRFS